ESTDVIVNGQLESCLTAETLVIKKKEDSKETASFTGNAMISKKVVVGEDCELSGKLICPEGEVILLPGSHSVGLIEADRLIIHPGATTENVELKVNDIQATLSGKFEGTLNLQPQKPRIKLAASSQSKGSEAATSKSGSEKAS
ncbi:MAG: hypothetical protein KDD43_14490, partial [Bdellovibrionales bacterium]|nr:hypothetical protein [Bdellovibrionales bacterium]